MVKTFQTKSMHFKTGGLNFLSKHHTTHPERQVPGEFTEGKIPTLGATVGIEKARPKDVNSSDL